MGLLRDGSGDRTGQGPANGPAGPSASPTRRALAAFAKDRSANPGGRPSGTPDGPDPHADSPTVRAPGAPRARSLPAIRVPGGARIRGVRIRGGPALAGAASAAVAEVDQPAPIPDPTAGAFFDVDNTLMRGASIYHFARGLAARKMFGPRDLAEMAWKQVYFRLRGRRTPVTSTPPGKPRSRSWPVTR